MPKLNDFQNSTVRLLDYLYFHDVVAMQGFSEEKSSIYSQLLAAIDLLAYRRSEGALIREHYKHLLLIGVDFELTFGKGELIKDDKLTKTTKHAKRHFWLNDVCTCHGLLPSHSA